MGIKETLLLWDICHLLVFLVWLHTAENKELTVA